MAKGKKKEASPFESLLEKANPEKEVEEEEVKEEEVKEEKPKSKKAKAQEVETEVEVQAEERDPKDVKIGGRASQTAKKLSLIRREKSALARKYIGNNLAF